MVIYGEYLFAENFITGYFLLCLTGKICGLPARRHRMVIGSVLCGLYAFILFVQWIPAFLSMVLKLLFSALLTFLVFGRKSGREFAKILTVFYLVSFAAGGITIGLMYFAGMQGVSGNMSLYMDGLNYANIAFGFAAAYFALQILVGFFRGKSLAESITADVRIEFLGRDVTMKGFLDTGNFLSDPVTGKPVILIEKKAALGLFSEETAKILEGEKGVKTAYEKLIGIGLNSKLRLIPFQSVGEDSGMLLGIRPDRVTVIPQRGDPFTQEVLLGIYEGDFGSSWDQQKYSVLLHPMVMEGGILCHA